MKKIIFVFLVLFLQQLSYAQELNNKDEEKVLMSAMDKNNPLHIWNMELTDYWVKLSDEILKDYKKTKLTPHQMAIIFLSFTEDFDIGYPKAGPHPKNVVNEEIGACGTFTNVFNALMAANGFKARVINLYNFPTNELGHTVSEIYYDGDWHLYDTTFSGYFTTEPSNIINPDVLSFEEIKNNKPGTLIIKNHRRYYKTIPLQRKFVSRDIYLNANPSGPVAFDYKLYYPIALDPVNRPVINREDFALKAQGGSFIGIGGANANHNYHIKGLVEKKKYSISITPKSIGGHKDLNNIKLLVSSKNCSVDVNEITYKQGDKNDLLINFTANGTSCTITVENNESPEFMKYLSIKKISVFTQP